jgi:hypothetical protein
MLLNLLFRVLPWYIREPLVITICLTLSCSSFYWTVKGRGWGMFGFGVLFLAFAAFRAYVLRGELRSRQAAKSATPAPASASQASDGV